MNKNRNMNLLLISPIGAGNVSRQFFKNENSNEDEGLIEQSPSTSTTFGSSLYHNCKSVPLESLTHEQVMSLVDSEDDLALIVDNVIW